MALRLAVASVGSHLSDGREADDALAEPEPEAARASAVGSPAAGLVGSLQCQTGWFGSFESARVELSRAGLLTVKLAKSTITADLTKPGTKVGEPKAKRSGRPFCVRVDAVDPAQKIVLDVANAADHQLWHRVEGELARLAAEHISDTREHVGRGDGGEVLGEREERHAR